MDDLKFNGYRVDDREICLHLFGANGDPCFLVKQRSEFVDYLDTLTAREVALRTSAFYETFSFQVTKHTHDGPGQLSSYPHGSGYRPNGLWD